MSGNVVGVLASKELRDALRNKWFLLYAVAFVALALGLSYLGLAGSSMGGMAGFSRTSAALVNLVMLIVPLMGLTIGAFSIAGERERGTLATLLTQPITRLELLLGKWLGLAAALAAVMLIGFGLPGIIMAVAGSNQGVGPYLTLMCFSLLFGLASLAIGMLISVLVSNTSVAVGLAIGVWLILVFVGDLGLLGAGMAMRMSTAQLLGIALVNPLTDFRVAALTVVGSPPENLGPAGLLLTNTVGSWTIPMLTAILVVWAIVPLVIGYFTLRNKEIL